jgi:hypothetical protein
MSLDLIKLVMFSLGLYDETEDTYNYSGAFLVNFQYFFSKLNIDRNGENFFFIFFFKAAYAYSCMSILPFFVVKYALKFFMRIINGRNTRSMNDNKRRN